VGSKGSIFGCRLYYRGVNFRLAKLKDDILVFYQHQTNRNGQPWIEPKKMQLANAIGVDESYVKVANGDSIAHDVAFYFLPKSD